MVPQSPLDKSPSNAADLVAADGSSTLRRCQPPADWRLELRKYDELARVATWPGPRYRMTYRILGEGPALIWIPGIASTYRTYTLVLNRLAEKFRTIQYDYPGRPPGRRCSPGEDHSRSPRRRSLRADGSSLDRAGSPRRDLVRLDDSTQGARASARAISTERSCRVPSHIAASRRQSNWRSFWPARARNGVTTTVAGSDPGLQQQDGLPLDHRGPLAVLSGREWADPDPRSGPSFRASGSARSQAPPGANPGRDPARSREGRPDCAAPLLRGAERPPYRVRKAW